MLARVRAVGAALRRALQRHVGARALGRSPPQLFCSRDRFGIKPFVFHVRGRPVRFASEPRAFLRDPSFRARPNLRAIRDFLAQGSHRSSRRDVLRRRASASTGSLLTLDERRAAARALLDARARATRRPIPVGAFRELFLDSIRLRLRSDVPLGTALSGGLDSSAVAVAIDHLLRNEMESARPVGERQGTFTAYFDDAGSTSAPSRRRRGAPILSEPH